MVKSIEIRTFSEEETFRLGLGIGTILKPEDVVLLVGDLGAGKTRMAKGIVSGATRVSPDEVVSPSFTLVNRFDGDFPVHHADLYRIEAEQIEGIGLEEALEEGGALIVEWAEKAPLLDPDALLISIGYCADEQERRILIQWTEEGSWDERIEAGVSGRTLKNQAHGGCAGKDPAGIERLGE